jgi:hypothetical protein
MDLAHTHCVSHVLCHRVSLLVKLTDKVRAQFFPKLFLLFIVVERVEITIGKETLVLFQLGSVDVRKRGELTLEFVENDIKTP